MHFLRTTSRPDSEKHFVCLDLFLFPPRRNLYSLALKSLENDSPHVLVTGSVCKTALFKRTKDQREASTNLQQSNVVLISCSL